MLLLLAVASTASAQNTCNSPFPGVCTWLQPAGGAPGDNKITVTISETATVNLMLDIPLGTTLLTFDAIINQVQEDFSSPSVAFNIVELNAFDPPGTMNFVTWGGICGGDASCVGDLPGMAHNDQLQYLVDTNPPLNAQSGTSGPITLVMGEIVIHGKEKTEEGFPHALRFYSPGGIGGDFGQTPANGKAPGGFKLGRNADTQAWEFQDVPVFHGVGGDPRFRNFFGVPYVPFLVNVQNATPEPSVLSLLLLGGLAAIRRRK
jgi:hypothetical protein